MDAVRGRRERSPRPQQPKDDGVAEVRTSFMRPNAERQKRHIDTKETYRCKDDGVADVDGSRYVRDIYVTYIGTYSQGHICDIYRDIYGTNIYLMSMAASIARPVEKSMSGTYM
jgi:hypothetical protein